MKPISLQEIRQVVDGKPLTRLPEAGPPAVGVCTDSRHVKTQELFVALRGEKFDGHRFLADVAMKGAIAALVEAPPEQGVGPLPLVQVANTRTALGALARHVRRQLAGKVVAVAGSNGKTGTKHLIHSILRTRLRGSISPKSFNNDIGVPLTIFPADPGHDYLVLELGTNHPGEIKTLTHMALPDVAVITMCSAEHLEFLGDLLGVRRENASIIDGLSPKGLLVVHGDDPQLLEAVGAYPRQRTVRFGFSTDNDLYASEVQCSQEGVRFRLNGRREVFVPLLGRHTACNSLAAIAVARRLGLDEEQIIAALASATGPEMRLQLQEVGPVQVLNDAYNANPASMKAAVDTLCTLPARRRVAVLGDMREMGQSAQRLHEEIGDYLAGCAVDLLVCVGQHAALIAAAAQRSGCTAIIRCFADATTAAAAMPRLVRQGDLVLLKGSRAMHLEQIALALAEDYRASLCKAAS
jgi:UDP-N-acetylmuramoyl-tripeptide--D-alanyl-D-alanine ligase